MKRKEKFNDSRIGSFLSLLCVICMVAGVSAAFGSESGITAFGAEAASIYGSTVTGKAGETVEVDIALKNNPGVASMAVSIGYDQSVMTLTKAENTGLFAGAQYVTSPSMDVNPYLLIWNLATSDSTANGVVAKLYFRIAADAKAGSYPVTINYDPDDIYNTSLDNVTFSVTNGEVVVAAPAPTPTPAPTPVPTETPGSQTGSYSLGVEKLSDNTYLISLYATCGLNALQTEAIFEGFTVTDYGYTTEFRQACKAFASQHYASNVVTDEQGRTVVIFSGAGTYLDGSVFYYNGIIAQMIVELQGEEGCIMLSDSDQVIILTSDSISTPLPAETPTPSDEPVLSVLYGDVTLDGEIKADDALEVLRVVVRLKTFDEQQMIAGDVSGDGAITAEDALYILKKVVRLIERFPAENMK